MRDPELYLIKLFRKAIHKSAEGESPDTASKERDDKNPRFLAMDYFDALIPQPIKIDQDINMFMDIYASPDEELSEHDVAMQSIPIYCSAEDIENHNRPVCVNSGNSDEDVYIYDNPFKKDKAGISYPYLSLIQVYIAPEIMARIESGYDKQNTSDRKEATHCIADQFYEDIHKIIEGYVYEHYARDRFKCRVYRAMSAGDFTVAVRSERPETSFILATLLRMRGCKYDDTGKDKKRYVFYKTYTLLSCNNQLIHCDQNDGNYAPSDVQGTLDDISYNGRFILRATFSSKYWAESAIEDNGSHEYARLSGRYDFSVELKEVGFRYVSKVLCDYKLEGADFLKWKEPQGEEKKKLEKQLGGDYTACIRLCRYISKGYLAYINERYIFTCSKMDILKHPEASETTIRLKAETAGREYISAKNTKAVGEVEKKLDRIYAKILTLDTNRRNILYHLNLLRRMLSLCRSINGLSDTRIYSTILIHHIDVVLDGVDDFYYTLSREVNENLIPIMEHAIIEAVNALNTYSKMIRDNNLQSLQTPNYNLESSVGVEKILVGYGELLNSLFKWYGGTKVCEEIIGLRQRYTPFMIPGEQEESLNTKVLFKEVAAETSGEKLIVVWSSAFSDLTNFGGTVGVLFHEVAHNLRYKGRYARNQIILKYCTYLICDQIAASIIDGLEQNIPELMKSVELNRLVRDSLFETYYQVIYKERDIPFFVRDFSYRAILDHIRNEYDKFVDTIRQSNAVDKFVYRSVSLSPDKRSPERKLALDKVNELRKELAGYRDHSFRRASSIGNYYEVDGPMSQHLQDAIESLQNYIVTHQDKDYTYHGDVSAMMIYNSLIDNKKVDGEFERSLPQYGLVDRFFKVLTEYLEIKSREYERSEEVDKQETAAEIRTIRRYLMRGNRENSVKASRLASNFSPHIIKTRLESLDMMEQAAVMYSEVASDLFMYNLVGMTPFGYFSFLSEYVPTDARTAHTYSRRFCTVMYAAFSEQAQKLEKAADRRRYWQGFIERLFHDFMVSAGESLAALYKQCVKIKVDEYIMPEREGNLPNTSLSYWFGYAWTYIQRRREWYVDRPSKNVKIFNEMNEGIGDGTQLFSSWTEKSHTTAEDLNIEGSYTELIPGSDDGKTLREILSQCEDVYTTSLRVYINYIYEVISKELSEIEKDRQKKPHDKIEKDLREKLHALEELQKDMTRWTFMATFLRKLSEEIIEEIETIETLEFLAEDYRDGYQNTRKLRDEFVVKSGGKDRGGCWLWPYFKGVKELLDHPEFRYDTEKQKQNNIRMIEMIQELYYRAIHDCAFDVIMTPETDFEESESRNLRDKYFKKS